jgi:hypothetical protein
MKPLKNALRSYARDEKRQKSSQVADMFKKGYNKYEAHTFIPVQPVFCEIML